MNFLAEIHNELLERGYEVDLFEAGSSIFCRDSAGYSTSLVFWVDDENENSWNGAKIMSNRIELDNDLNLGEKLLICNYFNNQMHYCSAYLSGDENEFFIVSACVPIGCENFVEICADTFEEVISATDYLIELIDEN